MKNYIFSDEVAEYVDSTGSRLKRNTPQKIKNLFFVQKANQVHGIGTFDYTEVEFINNDQEVWITCSNGHRFQQTPRGHIGKGRGCKYCYGRLRKTTEQFIEELREIFGDELIYTEVQYINSDTPVNLICPKHGVFPKIPYNILTRQDGCPECSDRHTSTHLYILKCSKTGLMKIGITSDINRRMYHIRDVELVYIKEVPNPRELEKYLHTKYSAFNVLHPEPYKDGKTEFFNLSSDQIEDIIQEITQL